MKLPKLDPNEITEEQLMEDLIVYFKILGVKLQSFQDRNEIPFNKDWSHNMMMRFSELNLRVESDLKQILIYLNRMK